MRIIHEWLLEKIESDIAPIAIRGTVGLTASAGGIGVSYIEAINAWVRLGTSILGFAIAALSLYSMVKHLIAKRRK